MSQMTLPHCTGSDTSRAAAESMRGHAADVRWRVLAHIRAQGEAGSTCEESEIALGLKHQTASARVNELHSGGFIVDSGLRRLTTSKRKAVVWIVRPA